ncbi:DinB family protein [Rubrivirga sp.]|uniref:DinB family protein n=1 Tax=Rubrivirga sp. TaxID=1885344 RepID=UPI003B516B8F
MTDALATLDVVRQTRRAMAAVVDALPDAARTTIPDGFNNHVLWNAGHVVATEQALTYGLSGMPPNPPDGFMADFRKRSSPRDWDRAWTWAEVRDLLLSAPDRTEADLRAGRFETFREYRTTPGVVLASAEDAVRFNLYHEGLHLGSILALRKLVGGRSVGQ